MMSVDVISETEAQSIKNSAHRELLYSTSKSSWFDFSINENGLWLLYREQDTKSFIAVKISPETLHTQKIWQLPYNSSSLNQALLLIECTTNNNLILTLFMIIIYSNMAFTAKKIRFAVPFRYLVQFSYNLL